MKKISLCIVALLFSFNAMSASLKGKVKIDGSSTVFPITEAIAEEFGKVEPRVRVQIGVSGTGGGFKKFVKNAIDINDASRSIKDKEKKLAEKNGLEFLELSVAYDGISVVINPENTWAKEMTVKELKKVWEPGSKVKLWSDIRATWPKKTIKLYGPGTDSGTFDYFTKAINGKSHVSRADFVKSEDDNVLVKGVAGNKYAMGFFGFAYYEENKKKLNAVKIDGVLPSSVSINNGTYKPLSRPIFIYVSKASAKRPEVKAFVEFYLNKSSSISKEVGYVALPKKVQEEQKAAFENFLK